MRNWSDEINSLAEQIMAQRSYADFVNKLASALEAAHLNGDAAFVTAAPSPVALLRARELAQTAAESLARDLTNTQLKSMGETLAQGLAEGKRPVDLYNKLQEVQSLDSNRARTLANMEKKLQEAGVDADRQARVLEKERQRLLRERRKTIANTEGRYATSEARRAAADDRKDEFKRWITSPDERLCEVCDGNENDGVIPINESFSSGHTQTPAHPNCRCTVAYIPGGKAKELAEKGFERKMARKEAARAAAETEEIDE